MHSDWGCGRPTVASSVVFFLLACSNATELNSMYKYQNHNHSEPPKQAATLDRDHKSSSFSLLTIIVLNFRHKKQRRPNIYSIICNRDKSKWTTTANFTTISTINSNRHLQMMVLAATPATLPWPEVKVAPQQSSLRAQKQILLVLKTRAAKGFSDEIPSRQHLPCSIKKITASSRMVAARAATAAT